MTSARNTRRSCLDAALRAYEDAGLRGLCEEGRREAAVEAIRAAGCAAGVAAELESLVVAGGIARLIEAGVTGEGGGDRTP
jgi:hypothetical protein